MHQPIPQQGRWLKQVVTGYFNYHAVPTNGPTPTAFLFHVTNLWRRTLRFDDEAGPDPLSDLAATRYHPQQFSA